ncbi:MAG: YafY family protein [Blastocatellia bacterium]|nr:YafY family protein [Blastocatellia bacterium]
MNRTDRLLAIVLELQRKGSLRAEDLAATFETCKRTIYRDIQALSESGVPIVSQPGLGYSLVEGYFLPPVSFSSDEATMLLLGSDFVADNFDAQYRDAARSASHKIEAVLKEKVRQEVAYLRNSIAFVATDTLSRDAATNALAPLRRAIIDRRTIRFHYHTRYAKQGQQARNTRDADPYGIVHLGEAWYLIAHCRLRNEIRNFKVDRMAHVEVLDQTFTRPPGFRLESTTEQDDRTLVIRALFSPQAAPWVREARSYYITHMEDAPDGLLVSLLAHTEDEVFNWLLGWGADVQILEPPSLQQRLLHEARKILKKYSAR